MFPRSWCLKQGGQATHPGFVIQDKDKPLGQVQDVQSDLFPASHTSLAAPFC